MKMIVLAMLLSGCATVPVAEQVRNRAANDLKCDAAQVQTTQVDADTIVVNACGQGQTYVRQCNVRNDEQNFSGEGPVSPSRTTSCVWVPGRGPGNVVSNPGVTTN